MWIRNAHATPLDTIYDVLASYLIILGLKLVQTQLSLWDALNLSEVEHKFEKMDDAIPSTSYYMCTLDDISFFDDADNRWVIHVYRAINLETSNGIELN